MGLNSEFTADILRSNPRVTIVKPSNQGQRYNISMIGFNALKFFPGQPNEMGLSPKGVHRGGKKLQIHPTHLTVVAGWKALGLLTGDGFIERFIEAAPPGHQ